MIHEKLKATNSNEFIIEDMVEISKREKKGNKNCNKQGAHRNEKHF